jgi:hypothetical protein
MIYRLPPTEDPIDQGDVIDGCPIPYIEIYDLAHPEKMVIVGSPMRVIVLTQTCDLANLKTTSAMVAVLHEAQELVREGILKQADIKGPVRSGRVWGWYFLPKNETLGLPEMIVDLRQLHTARMDLLNNLVAQGRRRGRVQPLYREHLARHFAETYARIGLPEPYPTDDTSVKTASPSPAPGNV